MYEMKSSFGDEKERSEVHLLMGKMKACGSKFKLSGIKSRVLDNLSGELRDSAMLQLSVTGCGSSVAVSGQLGMISTAMHKIKNDFIILHLHA